MPYHDAMERKGYCLDCSGRYMTHKGLERDIKRMVEPPKKPAKKTKDQLFVSKKKK